ncbi:cold shock domain-containing protein [Gordonia polyisoprenivorans]|uniref:Cold shock domain-containing protein n=1 Tax=Gordonia polyisoprenivorans TaxID=84595 RepID=A0A846WGQ4_9ACTN|nr:cold shock domain-containing protein [Gordonia polyisoprenivorans]
MPSTVGTVRVWHSEDGWGVLDSEATPGGAWAHFSEVVGDGFRSLTPGQEVEFEYEERAVDEYPYRANNIRGR